MKTISSVSELFEALGGTRAIEALLDVSAQQISNMRRANCIPPKHHFRIRNALPRSVLAHDGLFRPWSKTAA